MFSDKKHKVLFVTTSYPRFKKDTAGIFFLPLIKKLNERYFVSILAPDDEKVVLDNENIHFFRYAINRKSQKLAYDQGIPENITKNPMLLILFPAFIISMFCKVLCLSIKHDIIVSNWLLPSGLVCSFISFLLKKPHIVIDHSAGTYYLSKFPLNKHFLSFIKKNTKKILVVSPSLKEKLLEIDQTLKNHISIMPMGIDMELISKQVLKKMEFDKSYISKKETFKILFFGRAVDIKGLDILIKEINNIKNITLIVAGDEKNNIEKYRNLCLQNSVETIFLGKLFGNKKYELFQVADLIVFPSRIMKNGRSEGSPVTLIESLALGKMVVASNTGGIPYIIKHKINGFLFNPNKSGELRQIILDIIKNKQRYYNICLEAKISSKIYDINNTMHQLFNEFDKVLLDERT